MTKNKRPKHQLEFSDVSKFHAEIKEKKEVRVKISFLTRNPRTAVIIPWQRFLHRNRNKLIVHAGFRDSWGWKPRQRELHLKWKFSVEFTWFHKAACHSREIWVKYFGWEWQVCVFVITVHHVVGASIFSAYCARSAFVRGGGMWWLWRI